MTERYSHVKGAEDAEGGESPTQQQRKELVEVLAQIVVRQHRRAVTPESTPEFDDADCDPREHPD